MSRTAKRSVAIGVTVLLWACYILQEELARYGLYTLFGYGVHEMASLIPLVALAATAVALVVLIRQMVRKTGEKSNPWFVLVLAGLLLAQVYGFYDRTQIVSVNTVVRVKSVNQEGGTITVVSTREEDSVPVVLDTPDLVSNLVRVGDEEYVVWYESRRGQPEQGKLVSLSLCDP